MSAVVLSVARLRITYANGTEAVRGVDFEIQSGEWLALVGESGCGKTSIARAMLGLLPADAAVKGLIRIGDTDIVAAPPQTLRRLRGRAAGFVAQNPFEACHPLDRVELHVAEAWRAHAAEPPHGIIRSTMERLGIVRAAQQLRRYPHEWSGGMLQRATIAAAAAHHPMLIVADEPTSALDADRADTTLDALRATGAAVLLVSHDIGVVARHAERIAVCYAGRIVEIGPSAEVLAHPRHPYTRALLAATPRIGRGMPIPLGGAPPRLTAPIAGCSFAPRCSFVQPSCHHEDPSLIDGVACPVLHPVGNTAALPLRSVATVDAVPSPPPLRSAPTVVQRAAPVVEARHVAQRYGRGVRAVAAVRAASMAVRRGEIVGVAGPSGCGKSTLLRLLATIERPSEGEVFLNGQLATRGGDTRLHSPLARSGFVMPIVQNPFGSLDQRWAIWRTITEPLTAPHRKERLGAQQRREIARERLHEVGLAHIDLDARPHELSIGQCQRIAIARALAATPSLIIADEPTSALDASVAAAVVRLLAATAHNGTALVIVSHDRALLDVVCDQVVTMHDGVLELN